MELVGGHIGAHTGVAGMLMVPVVQLLSLSSNLSFSWHTHSAFASRLLALPIKDARRKLQTEEEE